MTSALQSTKRAVKKPRPQKNRNRYKEKSEAILSLARLFDAVTAKRGLFKTVLVRPSYA